MQRSGGCENWEDRVEEDERSGGAFRNQRRVADCRDRQFNMRLDNERSGFEQAVGMDTDNQKSATQLTEPNIALKKRGKQKGVVEGMRWLSKGEGRGRKGRARGKMVRSKAPTDLLSSNLQQP